MSDSVDERLDAELRTALAAAPQVAQPATRDAERLRTWYREERRHWNHPLPSMKTVENARVETPHGEVRVVWLHPPVPGPSPVIVFLHGGGWVVGGLDTHARMMRLLAERTGAVVVGVDYALSPEARFPLALEQVLAVVKHIDAVGEGNGVDPARMALAGDSAGANLAAAASMLLGNANRQVRALGLLYGAFGLRESASLTEFAGGEAGLSAEDMTYYYRAYTGNELPSDDPRVSPLQAPGGAFAPSMVIAAELDPLRDDSTAFADHLRSAGVDVEYRLASGLVHGFAHMTRDVTASRREMDALAAFLAARLA